MKKEMKIVVIKVKQGYDQSMGCNMYTAYCSVDDDVFHASNINREQAISALITGEEALKGKNYGVVNEYD